MNDVPDIDYFEVAKKLTRDYAGGAGNLKLDGADLEAAREIVKSLVDQIIYMAWSAHALSHERSPVGWVECEEPPCGGASDLLASLSVGHGIDMRISHLRRERDVARTWAETMEQGVMELAKLPIAAELESVKKFVDIIEEARRG